MHTAHLQYVHGQVYHLGVPLASQPVLAAAELGLKYDIKAMGLGADLKTAEFLVSDGAAGHRVGASGGTKPVHVPDRRTCFRDSARCVGGT